MPEDETNSVIPELLKILPLIIFLLGVIKFSD